MPTIKIPENALVLMVGASGSGKSTFARKHFPEFAVVSSDHCRSMICDDPTNQGVTEAAFKLLHQITRERLTNKRLVVVDATNVKPSSRQEFFALAREFNVPLIALVLNPPLLTVLRQNLLRSRVVPEYVIQRHHAQIQQALVALPKEPFDLVHTVNETVFVEITKNDHSYWEMGATQGFDVISDVHGCMDELTELLGKLGYVVQNGLITAIVEGRLLVFVGDFADRGPDSRAVLDLVCTAVNGGLAAAVLGNHDQKLMRALRGNNVRVGHGLAGTLKQLEDPAFRKFVLQTLESLPHQIRCVRLGLTKNNELIVTHAGIEKNAVGKTDEATLAHCIYGYTDGKNATGFPNRLETFRQTWPDDGTSYQVHGHIVTDTPKSDDYAVYNIDGGCVFGGQLNALRFPELEIVSVKARNIYWAREGSASAESKDQA